MTLDGALQIASAGLANINGQIAVVSQNVANVNTPGYSKEVSTQTDLTAAGQGMGVLVGPVQRDLNLALQSQVIAQNATVAALTTTQASLSGIDSVQGTPGQNNDLGSYVGALRDAFTSLQADPSNSSAQQQVVSAAGTLAGQINTLSQAYSSARQTAQNGVVSGITSLNASLATISDLTQRIMAGQAAHQSTADLENQRDAAITTASSLVGISFVTQSNGGMLAITQGGLGMEMLDPPPQFSVAAASAVPSTFYPGGGIGAITLHGADVTNQLTGGQIGADIALRDKTLPTYQGELDEFANTLNTRFSAQGLQLFTPPQGGTSSIIPTPAQTGYVGYAGSIAVNPAVLANPALVRDGTGAVAGSATGASAFTPNPSGTLSAPFQAPSDLAGFATDIVSSQSSDVSTTTNALSTETGVQQTLQSSFGASSQVNVDSEMSRMVQLQNAYGVTGHIIAAVQKMFTDLMQMVQ